MLFIIADASTNDILGLCGYLRICNDHGVIEIGNLHFSKQLKRTRLATEAIYLMMHDEGRDVFKRYHVKSTTTYIIRPDKYISLCSPGIPLLDIKNYFKGLFKTASRLHPFSPSPACL